MLEATNTFPPATQVTHAGRLGFVLEVIDPEIRHIRFLNREVGMDDECVCLVKDLQPALVAKPTPAPVAEAAPAPTPEHPAIGFVNALFRPDDWLCVFVLFADGKNATEFHTAAEIATGQYMSGLAEKNAAGANIYLAMNSLQPGADRRVKELAGKPAHTFIDVDENGQAALEAVREAVARGEVPAPSVIVRSSKNKYQLVWCVQEADFTFEKIEAVNESLVARFGADPASTDRLRLFRLPGFANVKYQERPIAEIVETNEGIHNFADFKLPIGEVKEGVIKPPAAEDELSSIVEYFEAAAAEAKLQISSLKRWGSNGYLWEVHPCPFIALHTHQIDSGSVVILHNSGALGYTCRHGHCAHKTWADFRAWMEGVVGHSLRFGGPKDGGILLGGVPASSIATADRPAIATPATDQVPVDPSDWRKYFKRVSELEDGDVGMLINGLLPEGTVFIGALSGHGKTLLGLAITRALTTGRPLFDHFEVPEQMPVLYLIPESSGRAFKARLKKFHIPDDDSKFLCRTLSDGPTLLLDNPYIRAAVEHLKPVVIIDTAIRFSQAADENAALQNQKLVNDMIGLRQTGARSVIAIHHSTKSSADGTLTLENVLRGTGDLGACADAVYGIRRDESLYANGDGPLEVEVVCVKPRDFDPPLPFRLIAKYRKDDGTFVSTIDTVGDFVIQDKQAESFNLTSRMAEIIQSEPIISLRALAEEMKTSVMKIRREVKKLGWTKLRGREWSLGPPSSQAKTNVGLPEHSPPSDECLMDLLAHGPRLVSEVNTVFAKHKYTAPAIESAKRALKVEVFRKHGDTAEWMRLPEESDAIDSPDEEES